MYEELKRRSRRERLKDVEMASSPYYKRIAIYFMMCRGKAVQLFLSMTMEWVHGG